MSLSILINKVEYNRVIIIIIQHHDFYSISTKVEKNQSQQVTLIVSHLSHKNIWLLTGCNVTKSYATLSKRQIRKCFVCSY